MTDETCPCAPGNCSGRYSDAICRVMRAEPDQCDTCERVHVDIVTEHDVMYSVAEIRAAFTAVLADLAWGRTRQFREDDLIAALRQRRAEQ